MDAGTAQLRFNNQDRALDPNNSSGPYYPNVVPMRRLKIEATWNSVTYPVFMGFVEDWPQTWQLSGKLAEVIVPVVDGFAVFGYGTLNSTYPAQTASARIGAVLDDLVWGSGQPGILDSATFGLLGSTAILGPVGDRTIGTSSTNLQAITLDSTFALEHLQTVSESEAGYFFISAGGSAVFIPRLGTSSTIQATFGDGGGAELPYTDLTLATSPIWNDVRFTAIGGLEQASADAASQTQYFKRSNVKSGYLQSSDVDVQGLADWTVVKYKQPNTRVTSILIDPQRAPTTLWPQVLGREIGDHVIVNRRPPGGGATISQESVIEGIEHAATPFHWTTKFWLSAADSSLFNFLLLGDAVRGLLGTGQLGP